MSTQTTIIERLLWICNTIFHQSVAVVGTFILWTLLYNLKTDQLFTWHTVLATLAYVPLMAEAIVLFSNENVWTQNIKRTTRYYIHGCLLFISAVLVSVAIGFMISIHQSDHFTTTHAWTGLVSWILVLLSQCLGIASAKSQALKGILRPVWFKFIHNILGVLGYLFGIVSLCFGLKQNAFTSYTSETSQLACTVVLGIVAGWTIISALKSAINQLRTILS